jgi:hypothetical protein
VGINIPYKEGDVPKAEKIGIGGNFIRIIGESKTHWRIEAFPHKPFPDLDPEEYNWFQTPWLVWKIVCVDNGGKLTNPAVAKRGGHVYIPYLHTKGELWIPKSRVELFPTPPKGMCYILRAASVFAWEDGELSPLMISKGRNRDFHTDWFQLNEFGVLAP